MVGEPYIPDSITVHLGPPGSNAQNVTVTFPEYIKNVASSEIYPTWPENAIRANIYAQISFALNRYYTEWYRSQGYDYDITNSTAYDQSYVHGRDIYDNINTIVDQIFNSYVRRQGSVEPYFTQYCNGSTVTCEGLSQWGTVSLAEEGMTPYEILQNFYGDDIDIVRGVPVRTGTPSYPGTPLRLGDAGNDVQTIQIQLNRISRNYPLIPKINPTDAVFGESTENAVRAFQEIFGLPVDGIVGSNTWYRIAYLYTAVKRLSELDSEGISLSEASRQYPGLLRPGDTSIGVQLLQYYLAVISAYYDAVPPVQVTGTFDQQTTDGVIAFQKAYGLTPDGLVGRNTWNDLERAYNGILESGAFEGGVALYPGEILLQGSMGAYVSYLQEYLSLIAGTFPSIPSVPVTGLFGSQTREAVMAFQREFGLPVTGRVDVVTWNRIASLFSDLSTGQNKQPGQNPGVTITESGAQA